MRTLIIFTALLLMLMSVASAEQPKDHYCDLTLTSLIERGSYQSASGLKVGMKFVTGTLITGFDFGFSESKLSAPDGSTTQKMGNKFLNFTIGIRLYN